MGLVDFDMRPPNQKLDNGNADGGASATPPNLLGLDPTAPGISGNNIARFTLNRHQRAINLVFVDGSARTVKLDDLLRLNWFRGMVPTDFNPRLVAAVLTPVNTGRGGRPHGQARRRQGSRDPQSTHTRYSSLIRVPRTESGALTRPMKKVMGTPTIGPYESSKLSSHSSSG